MSDLESDGFADPKAEIQKTTERALRLLARRDHSAYELKTKLRRKCGREGGMSDAVWGEVLASLKNAGYMADEGDLALRWVQQWRAEGRGRHWIQGKLKSKGLAAVPLRDDEEELEAAKAFIAKKTRGKTIGTLGTADKARLGRSMISRGFSSSVVASLLRGR